MTHDEAMQYAEALAKCTGAVQVTVKDGDTRATYTDNCAKCGKPRVEHKWPTATCSYIAPTWPKVKP